jgi:hypothetical protein
MILTSQILKSLPLDVAFRIVITRIQNCWRPMEVELKFMCIKTDLEGGWAIYYGPCEIRDAMILSHGDKVCSTEMIEAICPCDKEALSLYRI